jgi:hypothetical protein
MSFSLLQSLAHVVRAFSTTLRCAMWPHGTRLAVIAGGQSLKAK